MASIIQKFDWHVSSNFTSVTSRIVCLLKAAQNKEAVQLYISAKDAFPTEPPFCYHTVAKPDCADDEQFSSTEVEEDNMSVTDNKEAKLILDCLRKLYVG